MPSRRYARLPAALLVGVLGLALTGGCAPSGGSDSVRIGARAGLRAHGTAVTGAPVGPPPAASDTWHRAWHAEDVLPDPLAATTTCRFSARLTAAGSTLRLTFGSPGPGVGYRILAGSVARPVAPHSLEVDATTSVPLHFAGSPDVTVAARAEVVSDPLALPVMAGTDVLVTVTASAGDGYHKVGLVEPGACSDAEVPAAATAPARAFPAPGRVRWLRSVLVDGPAVRSVVALGDSLTEGPVSPDFGYERWSDQLVAPGVAVVNAGVGGGALSGPGVMGTMRGVDREQQLLQGLHVNEPGALRPRIAQPHIDDLVLLLGTNDLGLGRSAEDVLDSMATIVTEASMSGTQLWFCTLLPRGETSGSALERKRLAVNDALLSGRFSLYGVKIIDTAAAVADPTAPNRLTPDYDIGDHLHIDAEGARRVGIAVRSALNAPKVS